MGTATNIVADIYEVKIGGSAAGFHATVGVGALIKKHAITTGGTGEDIVGELVAGRTPVIEIEFLEGTLAQLRTLLGMGASDTEPPAVGTAVATTTVHLHLVADGATTTRDYWFFQVAFGDLELVKSDGIGEARWMVRGNCHRNSSGKVWQFGPVS
jgi:hypothetical protein